MTAYSVSYITFNLKPGSQKRPVQDPRIRELQGEGIQVVYESVLEDLRERDGRDAQRAVAPLIPAEDAFIIDTSNLDATSVFRQVVEVVNRNRFKKTGEA